MIQNVNVNVNVDERVAGFSGVMETKTVQKNGMCLKRLMSKWNQLMSVKRADVKLNFEMKSMYAKAKFAVILVFYLFVFTTLPSCDKSKQFDGTTWEGDCDFYSSDYIQTI